MRFVILVTVCALVAGCATPRSNTRDLDEQIDVQFLNAEETQVQAHSALLADVVGLAVKLGGKGLAALVSKEAERYEEKSRDAQNVFIAGIERDDNDPLNRVMSQGGLILLVRTLRTTDLEGLPAFDNGQRQDLARTIDAEARRNGMIVAREGIEAALRSGCSDADECVLAFAGVGMVKPRDQRHSFEIQLRGYKYPALKAKNLRVWIPFTDYHETDSRLVFGLLGPQQDPAFGGGRFTAAQMFEVTWNREIALDHAPAEWVSCKRNCRSEPITVPDFVGSDYRLTGLLVESSDMTDLLADLADRAEDIEID